MGKAYKGSLALGRRQRLVTNSFYRLPNTLRDPISATMKIMPS